MFVDSISGEESFAAHDCVKLFGHTDHASLQFDPGGYLSGGFVFDPGGSLQVDPHGFSALSAGETNGHQHPLFLHCTTIHSTQFGNGVTEDILVLKVLHGTQSHLPYIVLLLAW